MGIIMRRTGFSFYIFSGLLLLGFNSYADDVSMCAPSDQLNIQYKSCRNESHKPIFKADISEQCNSLPVCPNNTLNDSSSCKVTAPKLMEHQACGVQEYNTCEYVERYEKSEPRTCTSRNFDGIGSAATCDMVINNANEVCSNAKLLRRLPPGFRVQISAYKYGWREQKSITGHRIKASHDCEFTYYTFKPIKLKGPHVSCGVKQYKSCGIPGYFKCRREEFGIQSYSNQDSKACGVMALTMLDSSKVNSDKRCITCEHLPKGSTERFNCLRENIDLGVGLPGPLLSKARSESYSILLAKMKAGELLSAGYKENHRALRSLSDKEYEQIVWSFFAGKYLGREGRDKAAFYLSEEARVHHNTDWNFLVKMQIALKEFKLDSRDFDTGEIRYLLSDYFIRAYVAELEELRSEQVKVAELKRTIEGRESLNIDAVLAQAKSSGLSDERLAVLKAALSRNSGQFNKAAVITILSGLSDNLNKAIAQFEQNIKTAISQFQEANEGINAIYFDVYLNIANFDMRSALAGVRGLLHYLTEYSEWGGGFATLENMKMMIDRKAKAITALMNKLSQDQATTTGYTDLIQDLDPDIAAILLHASMNANQDANILGADADIQAVKDLLNKHYLMPLLQLKSEFDKKEE